MIKTPPFPVGAAFDDYVNEQIKKRQELQYSGFDKNRTDSELSYLTNRSSFIKLASSVNVDGDNGGVEKLLQLEGITEKQAKSLVGNKLAKDYVLSNGLSKYNFPLQRSGVSNTNNVLNASNYGTLGTEFGLQAMPGIQAATITSINDGSTREATIQIRANSPQQFDIIELLYLRLGHTMLIEWGHNRYVDTDGKVKSVESTLIDDGVWFDPKPVKLKNETGEFEEVNPLDFNGLIRMIQIKTYQYRGNYGGFYGNVKNFSWDFKPDGYYLITLNLISVGAVVESLRADRLIPGTTIPNPTGEEAVYESESNQNTLLNHLYCLRKDLAENRFNLAENNSDYVSVTGLEDEADTLGDTVKEIERNSTLYIRFGELLAWVESNICVHFSNDGDNYFPMLEFNISDQNYFRIFPGLISTNPKVCYIQNDLPIYKEQKVGSDLVERDMTKYFKPINDSVDNKYRGQISNLYINFQHIENCIKSQGKLQDNNISIFTFLKKLLDGVNSCFGGYVNLIPQLQDDYIVTIRDKKLEFRTDEKGDVILSNEENSSQEIKLFGYDTKNKQTSFVKDFSFVTKLDNDFSTVISVGAVNGNNTSVEHADFFENFNAGLVDRYKKESEDNNPKKEEKYTIKCAKDEKNSEQGSSASSTLKTLADVFLNIDVLDMLKNAFNPVGATTTASVNKFKKENNIQIPKPSTYDLYLEHLVHLLGPDKGFFSWGGNHAYFKSKSEDISKSKALLSAYINEATNSVVKTSQKKLKSSTIGIVPLELNMTLDGISGIKIYNQLVVDTKFLPKDYQNSTEFSIFGQEHVIQDNQWTTTLRANTAPKGNLMSMGFDTGEKVSEDQQVAELQLSDEEVNELRYPIASNNNREIIITSLFGLRQSPTSNYPHTKLHKGLDLRALAGTPMFPIGEDTEITGVGFNDTVGNFVKMSTRVKARTFTVQYFHLQSPPPVKVGQKVGFGVPVGYVGSTGSSTAPHVHFRIDVNGALIDPKKALPLVDSFATDIKIVLKDSESRSILFKSIE